MDKEIVERVLTMLEETLRWYRENKTDELELRDRELSYKERVLAGEHAEDVECLKWFKDQEKEKEDEVEEEEMIKDFENAQVEDIIAGHLDGEDEHPDAISEEKTDEHIEQDFEGEPEYAPIPDDAKLFVREDIKTREDEWDRQMKDDAESGRLDSLIPEEEKWIPEEEWGKMRKFTPWSLQRFKEILKANEEREESLVKAGGDDAPEDLRSADASLTRKYRTSIKTQLDYWVSEKRLTGYKTGARTRTLENTLMNILQARDDLAGSADHISLPDKEEKPVIDLEKPVAKALVNAITEKIIAERDKPVISSEFPEEQLKLLDDPDAPSNNKEGIAIGADEFQIISLKYIKVFKAPAYAEFIKGIALYRDRYSGQVSYIKLSSEICVSQYAMLTDAMCVKVKTSFSDILTEK